MRLKINEDYNYGRINNIGLTQIDIENFKSVADELQNMIKYNVYQLKKPEIYEDKEIFNKALQLVNLITKELQPKMYNFINYIDEIKLPNYFGLSNESKSFDSLCKDIVYKKADFYDAIFDESKIYFLDIKNILEKLNEFYKEQENFKRDNEEDFKKIIRKQDYDAYNSRK